MKRFSIEVNEKMYEAICSIFNELNLSVPEKITSYEMQKAACFMKYKIKRADSFSNHENKVDFVSGKINKPQSVPIKRRVQNSNDVLVISKLGIIRYQLKVLLNNRKFNVTITDSLYMGMAEYIKRLPPIVIVDMGNDSPEATLDLVNRINQWAERHDTKTKIITLSSKIDYILRQKCLNKGIDNFIFKKDNWHSEFNNVITDLTEEKKKELPSLESLTTAGFYSYTTT